jgi:HK97 family phage prohead protease
MLIKGWASTQHVNSYDFAVVAHAFAAFIAEVGAENIPFLLCHEPHRPAGRIIVLETQAEGLWIEAELDPKLLGVKQRIGDISRNSPYGFSVGIGEAKAYRRPSCGTTVVYRATLREVSLTDGPSNMACTLQSFEITQNRPDIWPADFIELFVEQSARRVTHPFVIPDIRYEATP